MTEPKACPFRPSYEETNIITYELANKKDEVTKTVFEKRPVFGPCLQDKCQMWRVSEKGYETVVEDEFGAIKRVESEYVGVGYCGLAGKP
jgi:hypothetical protein